MSTKVKGKISIAASWKGNRCCEQMEEKPVAKPQYVKHPGCLPSLGALRAVGGLCCLGPWDTSVVLGERQQAVHETYGMPCIHSLGLPPSSCCFLALEVLQPWWQLWEDLDWCLPGANQMPGQTADSAFPSSSSMDVGLRGSCAQGLYSSCQPSSYLFVPPKQQLMHREDCWRWGDEGRGGQLQPTPDLFCAERKNIAVPIANPLVFQNLH